MLNFLASRIIFIMAVIMGSISCSMFNPVVTYFTEISLSSDSVYLSVGETQVIEIETTPIDAGEDLIFTSSVEGVVDYLGDNQSLLITGKTTGMSVIDIKGRNTSRKLVVNVTPSSFSDGSIYLATPSPVIVMNKDSIREISVVLIGKESNFGYEWFEDGSVVSITPNEKNAVIKADEAGETRLTISHPDALFDCEIIVIVEDSTSYSNYIKTSKNIITLYDDGQTKTIDVSLHNGLDTDMKDFLWSVDDPNICALNFNNETALITGMNKGEASITISHPKASYDFKINIIVVRASFESYIQTSLNYLEIEDNVLVTGSVVGNDEDNNLIEWASSNEGVVKIMGNGPAVTLQPGGVYGEAIISVTHPEVLFPTAIYVFNTTAANTTEINTKTAYLTASRSVFNIESGTSRNLFISIVNGNVNETITCLADSDIVTVSQDGSIFSVKGNTPGVAYLSFTTDICEKALSIRVVVHPEGTNVNDITTPRLEAPDNVIYLYRDSAAYDLSINMVGDFGLTPEVVNGILTFPYMSAPASHLVWSTDSDIIDVVSNGISASILPRSAGECWLSVTHPESENILDINVIVKDQLEGDVDIKVPYITTNNDFVSLVAKGKTKEISVSGFGLPNTSSYYWVADDNSIIELSFNGDKAQINGLKEGTTFLTVSHPTAPNDLQIMVKVLPEGTMEEGFIYITSSKNIVSSGLGLDTNVSVSLVGGELNDISGFVWSVDDPSTTSLIANNNTAILQGLKKGSSTITISHPEAEYDYKIIHFVVEVDVNDNINMPTDFILTSNYDFIDLIFGSEQQVKVKLSGASELDLSDLTWTVDKPFLLSIIDNKDSAILQPNNLTGLANVTISHPDALNDADIICKVYSESSSINDSFFISSNNNIVSLISEGSSKSISVNLAGGVASDSYNFVWAVDKPEIVTLSSVRDKAVISTTAAGEALITVSHPKAEYDYKIKVLSFNVDANGNLIDADGNIVDIGDVCYIRASEENMLVGKNDSYNLDVSLVNGEAVDNNDFSWTVDKPDLINLIVNGNQAILETNDRAGVAVVTITHPRASFDKEVNIIIDSDDISDLDDPDLINGSIYIRSTDDIVYLTDDNLNQSLSVELVGGTALDNNDFIWSVDNSTIVTMISNQNDADISSIKSGEARIEISHPKASYPLFVNVICNLESDGGYSLADAVFIENINPFIQMVGGSSRIVDISLIGGNQGDEEKFTWISDDPSIVSVSGNGDKASFSAVSSGETRIRIFHPDAKYEAFILVSVSPKPLGSKLYLSTSTDIVQLSPSDEDFDIFVELENSYPGDLGDITWSIDRPDIASITSNGKSCSISPQKEGIANIQVRHPLSNNILNIVVKVSLYFTFEFSDINMTIYEGDNEFVPLRIPYASSTPVSITYTSDNPDIVSITGTDKTCQVTAERVGTTVVRAESTTGHTTNMMINVEERPADGPSEIYISSSKNTYQLKENGNTTSVSAQLIGGSASDQNGLMWISSDTSIINVFGSGQSVLFEPVAPGNTTVVVSHDKAELDFIMYVKVDPDVNTVELSKAYIILEYGDSFILNATLSGGSSSDYSKILWECDNKNVVTILGSGKTPTLYAAGPGQANISAQYPGGPKVYCEVYVKEPVFLLVETNYVKVEPGSQKTISFDYSPENAQISWNMGNPTLANFSVDYDTKKITFYGLQDGTAVLTGSNEGRNTAVQVDVGIEYTITPSKIEIIGEPRQEIISYECYPDDSYITFEITDPTIAGVVLDRANNRVTVTPKKEGTANITLINNGVRSSILYDCKYPAITGNLREINSAGERQFGSYISNDGKANAAIYMEDGELQFFNFTLHQPYVDAEISSSLSLLNPSPYPGHSLTLTKGGSFYSLLAEQDSFSYSWHWSGAISGVKHNNSGTHYMGDVIFTVIHNGETDIFSYPLYETVIQHHSGCDVCYPSTGDWYFAFYGSISNLNGWKKK